jgi:hypothetical protein
VPAHDGYFRLREIGQPKLKLSGGLEVAPRLCSGGTCPVGRIAAEAAGINLFGICERAHTNDPSPRLNRTLPDPNGEIAAAWEMRLLTERIIRLAARIGMSDVEATMDGSEPNRI